MNKNTTKKKVKIKANVKQKKRKQLLIKNSFNLNWKRIQFQLIASTSNVVEDNKYYSLLVYKKEKKEKNRKKSNFANARKSIKFR